MSDSEIRAFLTVAAHGGACRRRQRRPASARRLKSLAGRLGEGRI
jgi:hypothetical protein